MKTFKELCEAHLEFERVVKEKYNEYCTIHKCKNPYHEDDGEVYIGDDTLTIAYKIYNYGDYECKALKIPMSFYESDEHTEEEQKALEKAETIKALKLAYNIIAEQTRELEQERNRLKRDLDDIARLSKLNIIKDNSEEFNILYRRYYDEIRPVLDVNYKRLDLILKQIQGHFASAFKEIKPEYEYQFLLRNKKTGSFSRNLAFYGNFETEEYAPERFRQESIQNMEDWQEFDLIKIEETKRLRNV